MDLRPKFDTSFKPDFMAPTPKLNVSENMNVSEMLEDNEDPALLDPFQALDESDRKVKFYRSERILGRLFREIDERKFFTRIQNSWNSKEPRSDTSAILARALQYVLHTTQ